MVEDNTDAKGNREEDVVIGRELNHNVKVIGVKDLPWL